MLKKISLWAALIAIIPNLSYSQENTISLKASVNRYSMPTTNNTIAIEVKNNNSYTINSLEINWNDGVKNHFSTINTNILPGNTEIINHPIPVSYSGIVEKNIAVTLSKVNSIKNFKAIEANSSLKFNTLTRKAKKAVLIEEGTGTWCSGCPAGDVAIKYMYEKYPNSFVGIAVHRGSGGIPDPMEYTPYRESHTYKGLPGFNVDRVILNEFVFGKIKAIEPHYNKRINVKAPADLDAKANITGEELSIEASAKFYSDFSNANFRLGIILTENGITGPSPEYDQSNGYSGDSSPMGGYEKLPNPVPGNQMVYDHVGRALLGGFDGQRGSVPTTIKSGDIAKYTFKFKIPSEYKKDKLKAVIVLIDQSNGAIANSKEVDISRILSVDKKTVKIANIYPNPASDKLNISFKALAKNYRITVFDNLGREILSKNYSNLSGFQNIVFPTSKLSKGSYILNIANNKTSYSQTILIK